MRLHLSHSLIDDVISEGQLEQNYSESELSTMCNISCSTKAICISTQTDMLPGVSSQLLDTNHHLADVTNQIKELTKSHEKCCTSTATLRVEKCWNNLAGDLQILNSQLLVQNSALKSLNSLMRSFDNRGLGTDGASAMTGRDKGLTDSFYQLMLTY
jgi:hypothetical protein